MQTEKIETAPLVSYSFPSEGCTAFHFGGKTVIWSNASVISTSQLEPKRLLVTAWKMIEFVHGGSVKGEALSVELTLRELAETIVEAANEIRMLAAKRAELLRAHAVGSPKKIGRNDRCPCGSGGKWKKCHGRGVS